MRVMIVIGLIAASVLLAFAGRHFLHRLYHARAPTFFPGTRRAAPPQPHGPGIEALSVAADGSHDRGTVPAGQRRSCGSQTAGHFRARQLSADRRLVDGSRGLCRTAGRWGVVGGVSRFRTLDRHPVRGLDPSGVWMAPMTASSPMLSRSMRRASLGSVSRSAARPFACWRKIGRYGRSF